MRRSILPLGPAAFAALLLGNVVQAQPKAQPKAPPAPAVQPAPVAAAPAQLPAEVDVNDPMLTPVPRAKVEVNNWEEALQYVRSRSTDLRIAAAGVVRAEAQSRIALAGALLNLNGQGSLTHNLITNETLQPISSTNFSKVQTPFPNFATGSITATQPVLALRSWYAIGTADRNETVARLSVEDAKRQIALGVANSIVGVVTAERIAELNRVGLRNALTRLELANRRSTLGSGTGLDVIRARQDVEASRATLVAGDESLRQAREALGLALGVPEQVGIPPGVDINGLEASTRTTCKPGALEDRADIAGLRERTEVARRQVTDVKLQFAPTVDVRSTLGTTTVNTGAAPNTTWNVQAVLTVPIWDGGIRYGNLRDTRAQEVIAGLNLEAARRQAQIQVTQAQRGVGVADDRRRVAVQSRDLAAENDRLTRTAYLEGRGTSLELVTAAQALRETEIQLALREFELVKARVLAILALASCPW